MENRTKQHAIALFASLTFAGDISLAANEANAAVTVPINTLSNGEQSFARDAPSGEYDTKVSAAGQSDTAHPLLNATVNLDSQLPIQ